jgi:hypothetical protein
MSDERIIARTKANASAEQFANGSAYDSRNELASHSTDSIATPPPRSARDSEDDTHTSMAVVQASAVATWEKTAPVSVWMAGLGSLPAANQLQAV